MRDPYENITIGNFIYGLGLTMGRRCKTDSPPGALNLLQQTPADSTLADVLIQFPGVIRLIEFKRKNNNSPKELLKRERIATALTGRKDLVSISRSIHWYIETEPLPAEKNEWLTTICPYLDLGNTDRPSSTLADYLKVFTDEVLDETSVRQAPALVKEYLALISRTPKSFGGSSAMLLSVAKDGGLNYIVVNDYRDLELIHKKLIEMVRDQAKSIELENSQLPDRTTRDRHRERDHERGHGFGR